MNELYSGSIKIPHGEAEIRSWYGDIKLARIDGRMQIVAPRDWEQKNLVVIRDFPGLGEKALYVHRLIVEPLRAALTEAQIWCPDYKIKTIGCFNPRMKRTKGDSVSLHSWAVAVDINAAQNPMKKPMECDMPPAFIDSFKRAGWKWGGEFPTPDPMHWQLATGY